MLHYICRIHLSVLLLALVAVSSKHKEPMTEFRVFWEHPITLPSTPTPTTATATAIATAITASTTAATVSTAATAVATFSLWQNAHIYDSAAECKSIENNEPEQRSDDYIVLNANYGLKLRNSQGYLSDGSHKFKRVELKTRTQVDGRGGETWKKEELGAKPGKKRRFSNVDELDAFVLAAVQTAACKHLVKPPISYVRVEKERRAIVVGQTSVEQTDFYLRSILVPPAEAKQAETKEKEREVHSSVIEQCSTTSSTAATTSTSSSGSSTSAVSLSSTSRGLNRRFRSIAFEKSYNQDAADKIIEAVRNTLKPGHPIFIGGYAGFIAHLHGKPENQSIESQGFCALV